MKKLFRSFWGDYLAGGLRDTLDFVFFTIILIVILNILNRFFSINQTLNVLVKNIVGTFTVEGWFFVVSLLISMIFLRLKFSMEYMYDKSKKITEEYVSSIEARKNLEATNLDIKKKTKEAETLLEDIEIFKHKFVEQKELITSEEHERHAINEARLKEKRLDIESELGKEDIKLKTLESTFEQLTVEVNDLKNESREKNFQITCSIHYFL